MHRRGVMRLAAGASGAPVLDLATWGTFTRDTEASYLTAAATTGDTPFVAWAPKDVRRIERRGSAYGYLTEGAGTNLLLSTEDVQRSGGGWSIPGGNTIYTTLFPAPDGCLQKGRIATTSGSTGPNYIKTGITTNQDWVCSAYHRSPTGTTSYQDAIGGSTLTAAASAALSTTWTRAEMLRLPDNAFGQIGTRINDGRNWTAWGGLAAGARDALYWGLQLEQASYPSSYIRTEDYNYGAATRAPDILSGTISSIPAAMVDGAWAFTVAPVGSSTGMVRRAATQVLFSFAEDASETIEFAVYAGSLYLRVVSGGVARVTSAALTFSAHQELTVTLDGADGSLTVAGATSGNGTVTDTSWTRSTGSTLYVGALADASSHADARLWCGAAEPAVSASKYVVFTLGQSNMITHALHDRVASWIQVSHPDTKLIDGAKGSTSLAVDWESTAGAQYAIAVAKWNDAVTADPTLTGYTPIIIWIQGEADAANATWAAAYGANLVALEAALATDIPQLDGCLWIVGQLPTTTTTAYGATSTTIGQVRTGQSSFVTGLGSRAAIVDPSDLTFDPTPANLHFDNASSHVYAARIGVAAQGLGV